MSKLLCQCGHLIVDQTDNLSYSAQLIPDQYFYEFFDRIRLAIDELIKATKDGKRREWIEQMFTNGYPKDLSDAEMIDDVFGRYYWDYQRDAYQCEQCSRLWIQIGKTNHFSAFMPENETGKNILGKQEYEPPQSSGT